MIKSHLLIAFRMLSQQKTFSLIAILGLSVSIAACILMIDHAKLELSYDRFFNHSNRIYRVQHNRYSDNQLLYKKAMSFPEVVLAMQKYFPEIEAVARMFPVSTNIEPVFSVMVNGGRRSFSEPNAYLVDSSFTKIFHLDFIHGDPNSALNGPDKIIVSKSTALKYFGRLDVVGEVLQSSTKMGNATIAGVFDDLPPNTHFQFDVLLSWFNVYGDVSLFKWDGFYSYILLRDESSRESVMARMPQFTQSYMGDFFKQNPSLQSEFELQPLTDIHLTSHLEAEMKPNSNTEIVYGLLAIACLTILIAVVNHVNLNTSRSLSRTKEVGVRKVIGSTRFQLSIQFFVESLIVVVLASIIGLTLSYLLLPHFNRLFNSHIQLYIYIESWFWICLAFFLLTVSLIAGIYPTLVLAASKAREALKGAALHFKHHRFQTSLVTFQFSVSLILIIATYVLYRQLEFMKSRDLGFIMERKVVVKLLPGVGEEGDTIFVSKLKAIKTELKATAVCRDASISSNVPGRKNDWAGMLKVDGKETSVRMTLARVDNDFIDAFNLKLLAGRNFLDGEKSGKVIVNLETIRQLGIKSPEEALGVKINVGEIIGVVDSFHEVDLRQPLAPAGFFTGGGYMKFLTVSVSGNNVSEKVATIENVWKKFFPDKPFQYFFLDDFFNRQYEADVQMGKSVGVFSLLAVMIGCLGLLSLSIQTIYRKTKEIGIRKVLGAGSLQIMGQLGRLFLKPIVLSAFIAIPTSYYLVTWWLQQYTYKMEITFYLFVLPFLLLIGLGLITILVQSGRAAAKNPVDSLRYE